jgi:hypothetical protein
LQLTQLDSRFFIVAKKLKETLGKNIAILTIGDRFFNS